MALCYKSTHKIHKFYRASRSDIWGLIASKKKHNFISALVLNFARSNLNQKLRTLSHRRRRKVLACFPRQLFIITTNIILRNLLSVIIHVSRSSHENAQNFIVFLRSTFKGQGMAQI